MANRLGSPATLATSSPTGSFVVFLAAPTAGRITGQTIRVDDTTS